MSISISLHELKVLPRGCCDGADGDIALILICIHHLLLEMLVGDIAGGKIIITHGK